MAGKPGFEPRLTDPESAVLPLNYFPSISYNKLHLIINTIYIKHKNSIYIHILYCNILCRQNTN